MAHVAVSRLAYAHPGGDLLFSDVSFRLSPGQHAGLVGTNGVGKSTLLKMLAGELLGPTRARPRSAGSSPTCRRTSASSDGERTVRELLLSLAPPRCGAPARAC